MKRILSLLFASVLLFLMLFALSPAAAAVTPLDEIRDYTIFVSARDDGTLDLRYKITWLVLDSGSEGPLSWVRIGVPNRKYDEAKALSSTIDYLEKDGSYVEVYFTREYLAGEEVTFEFSIHQDYMYVLSGDSKEYAYYEFIPGWFDEIRVDQIGVYWKTQNVTDASTDKTVNIDGTDYYYWGGTLDYGQSFKTRVYYDKTVFPDLDPKKTADNIPNDSLIFILILVGSVLLLVVILVLVGMHNADPYYTYRGFYPHYAYYHLWYHPHRHRYSGVDKKGATLVPPASGGTNGGGFSKGGGSCACACACACAGGGRAGCARKDFYHPNLELDQLEQELKKQS